MRKYLQGTYIVKIKKTIESIIYIRHTIAWEVRKLNDNTAVGLLNVTDMEGLQSVMSSPKVQEWNTANNAVADVYALEKVS